MKKRTTSLDELATPVYLEPRLSIEARLVSEARDSLSGHVPLMLEAANEIKRLRSGLESVRDECAKHVEHTALTLSRKTELSNMAQVNKECMNQFVVILLAVAREIRDGK